LDFAGAKFAHNQGHPLGLGGQRLRDRKEGRGLAGFQGASGNDPGRTAVGHFVIDEGVVFFCDVNGNIDKDAKGHEVGDLDPKYIAQMLLRNGDRKAMRTSTGS